MLMPTAKFVVFAAILAASVAVLAEEPVKTDGPKCSFVGVADKGTRIAYLSDASGSMLSMFDSLRVEIFKSVDSLKPEQSFNVVFFRSRDFHAVDRKAMLPVTPENKQRLHDFLDKMFVTGETDPMPSLEFAFKQELDVIYLLTDGDFNGHGNDAVVKFCQEKTKGGKPRINTLAFVSKDEKEKPDEIPFVKALKAIAKNSGGQFRVVTDDDLGK